MRTLRLAIAAAVLCAPTLAQYPIGAVGFQLTSNLGPTAGSFCWWFNCTPAQITLGAGEIATLRISGEYQAQFVLGSSSTATSCLAVPGILHSVVIDQPIAIMAGGALNSISPVLACPNGYTLLSATVPPGIPPGTTLALQALTYGAGNVLSLTGAILVTFT